MQIIAIARIVMLVTKERTGELALRWMTLAATNA
jgi:hypothetical protein